MDTLLSSYDANQNMRAKDIIARNEGSIGLTADGKKVVSQVSDSIKGIQEKLVALSHAKDEGKSTKRWIMEEMDTLLDGQSEADKAKLAASVAKLVSDHVESANQNN